MNQALAASYTPINFAVLDGFIQTYSFEKKEDFDFDNTRDEILYQYDPYELYNYLDLKEDDSNHWILFFKAMCLYELGYDANTEMKQATDLGNKLAKKYIDRNNEIVEHWLIIDYINSYFDWETIEDLDNRHREAKDCTEIHKEMDRTERRVLSDLKTIPEIFDDEEAALEIARIYQNLDQLFEANSYVDETICWLARAGKIHDLLEINEGGIEGLAYIQNDLLIGIVNIVNEHHSMKNRLERLEQAYEELKKVREMDFNDIISNGVGEYL